MSQTSAFEPIPWPELKDDERGRGLLAVFRKFARHSERRLHVEPPVSVEPEFVTAADNPAYVSGGIAHDGKPVTSREVAARPSPFLREPKKLWELCNRVEERCEAQAVMDYCAREGVAIDPAKVAGRKVGTDKGVLLPIGSFLEGFRERCRGTASGRKFLSGFREFFAKTEPAAELSAHSRVVNDGKNQKVFGVSFYNSVKSRFLRKFETDMLSNGKPDAERCLKRVLGYWPAQAFDRMRLPSEQTAVMADGSSCGVFPKDAKAFERDLTRLADSAWKGEEPLASDERHASAWTMELERRMLRDRERVARTRMTVGNAPIRVVEEPVDENLRTKGEGRPEWQAASPGVVRRGKDGQTLGGFADIANVFGYERAEFGRMGGYEAVNPIVDYVRTLGENIGRGYMGAPDFDVRAPHGSPNVAETRERAVEFERWPGDGPRAAVHIAEFSMCVRLNNAVAHSFGGRELELYEASVRDFHISEAAERFGFTPDAEGHERLSAKLAEADAAIARGPSGRDDGELVKFRYAYDDFFRERFFAPTVTITTQVAYDSNASNPEPFSVVTRRSFAGDPQVMRGFPKSTAEITHVGGIPSSFEEFKEMLDNHVKSQYDWKIVNGAVAASESERLDETAAMAIRSMSM